MSTDQDNHTDAQSSSAVAESSTHERIEELEDALEQACRDLNAAHDKIIELQNDEADVGKYDWPEWSSPANTIRWAEELLDKRLAKTENWTLHPSEASG